MRWFIALITTVALALLGAQWVAAGPASAAVPNSITAGNSLGVGGRIESANGHYVLVVQADGNVVEYAGRTALFSTHTHGATAVLQVRTDGNVVVVIGKQVWWSGTYLSGKTNKLYLDDSGRLELLGAQGLIWSSVLGNGCGANPGGKRIYVSISEQLARACVAHEQMLLTSVTTGASTYGYGTPTGSWTVDAKVRDTTLYPAAGGAYPVQYWMPYVGNTYGFHDASWQTMPYGSALYRTEGSHGCVHVPLTAMAWLFNWAAVGTGVTVAN